MGQEHDDYADFGSPSLEADPLWPTVRTTGIVALSVLAVLGLAVLWIVAARLLIR